MKIPAIRQTICAALLLASANVPAQLAPGPSWVEYVTGENISFSEATWELFERVAEADKSPMFEELPGRLRLDDKRASALFAHIKAAVKESQTHAASLRKTMCTRRAAFTTIENVARELDRIDEEVLDHRDKLMSTAGPILGLDGTARLEAVVMEVRNSMSVPRVDYLEAMRDRKETPVAVMTRLCAEFK